MAKEISLGAYTAVSELAALMAMPAKRVIEIGFNELGLFLTIIEELPFERAQQIARAFGYTARRK